MKKYVFLLTPLLCISCLTDNNVMNIYNNTVSNGLFYVIDTIKISSPVVIYHDHLYYVTSEENLTSINNSSLKRQDVFLYDGNGIGFYMYIDMIGDMHKYDHLKIGHFPIKFKNRIKGNIELYDFAEKPSTFILCLINVDYYNLSNRSIITCGDNLDQKHDNPYIRDKSPSNSYRKIAFPMN